MQAAGWIVIILFGFIFALLAVFLVSQLILCMYLVPLTWHLLCLPMV